MEAHPIPQNVTSFQFKLIGDMTLKQFLYLAAGLVTAYLLFVLIAHDYPLVAWPLIISSALLGVGFAFVPVGSRPLDHWLSAFLKAIYSPTKREWKREGDKTYKENPLFSSRLVIYLQGLQSQPTQTFVQQPVPLAIPQASPVETKNPQPIAAPVPAPKPAEPLPTPEELGKTVDLARQAQNLQMKIIQNERTLAQIKAESQKPAQIPVDYSHEVNKILADLQGLVKQASSIKQQIQKVQEPEAKPTIPAPPVVSREKVTVVIPQKPKQQTTVALTSFPNVINGIVKDSGSTYLEGVIAVIYDKEGLPVRALKTNKLGQFTGSTPLPNGTYTLEIEKEGFAFDVLQIELTGEILPPLLITAK